MADLKRLLDHRRVVLLAGPGTLPAGPAVPQAQGRTRCSGTGSPFAPLDGSGDAGDRVAVVAQPDVAAGVTEDCLQGVQHMALCSAIHFCSATVGRSVVLSR